MKHKKKNYFKISIYIAIIFILLLISYFLLKPSEEDIVNKLNEKEGPLQIEKEFLGPNIDDGLTPNL